MTDEATRRYQGLAQVLSDLDRCEHGRHEGDPCGGVTGCNGPSRGNPRFHTGDRIGTGLHHATAIVVPPWRQRSDPDAWYVDLTENRAVTSP